ncbi:MAG: hypothetical protein RR317_05490 [Bilophila sp.]
MISAMPAALASKTRLVTGLSVRTEAILDKALSGLALSRSELLELVRLDEHSLEAAQLRATADTISRTRFANKGMLLAQVGVEAFPCPANCGFCSFGEEHFSAATCALDDAALTRLCTQTAGSDALYAFFLMFMHTYDFERVLRSVRLARKLFPSHTDIVLNMGDFDQVQAKELKSAGANGVYHVSRLREGVDTSLHTIDRLRTIAALKAAGLDWYTCCEPIGPEHSPEELVDQILIGRDYDCFQHAVMRRVAVPGTPLAERGQITSLRFAQLAGVVALAMIGTPSLTSIAVHEPDMVGLTSGGNCVYAEFGVNPRDTAQDTSNGRGFSITRCTSMLHEAGYEGLMQASTQERCPSVQLLKAVR